MKLTAERCTCGERVYYGTDGNGRLVAACPHCTWGHPLTPRRAIGLCAHGVPEDESCEACRFNHGKGREKMALAQQARWAAYTPEQREAHRQAVLRGVRDGHGQSRRGAARR